MKFLFRCFAGIKKSENVIIMPAQNGVKIFIPLFVFINKFYKRKIFYIVIGGWLPHLIKDKTYLLNKLKELDKIFVETNKMKEQLEKINIKNVEILVNFKNIKIIDYIIIIISAITLTLTIIEMIIKNKK